jgi:hypothetical protein
MKIAVVEKDTGKVVYLAEVNWLAQSDPVHMKQIEAEAWKAGVEDGDLKEADKIKYAFQVLND